MRAAAQQIGVWDAERTALLSGLARANELDLLVRVFLDEGEIGQALEALAALKEHERYHSCHTDLAVVQAAEATRPEAAIEIYLDVARLLIRQRDRGSYAEAARYVTRVRDLLQKSRPARLLDSAHSADTRRESATLRPPGRTGSLGVASSRCCGAPP